MEIDVAVLRMGSGRDQLAPGRPLAPADFGAGTLAALDLHSARGDLAAHHAGTADVVRTLYGAAASGSVYRSQLHGAYMTAMDFGTAVLRSDHRSVAIIAGTFAD